MRSSWILLALCVALPCAAAPEKTMSSNEKPVWTNLVYGPYLEFTSPNTAMVRWKTHKPAPSQIELIFGDQRDTFTDDAPTTDHAVELSGLKKNTLYTYRIVAKKGKKRLETPDYECDTTFNYSIPPIPDAPHPYPEDKMTALYTAAAETILAHTGITRGYCIDIGCNQGRLAYELAKRSDLYVMGFDSDEATITKARNTLKKAGAYGARITLRHADDLADLPLPPCSANLIVSDRLLAEGKLTGSFETVYTIVRPQGGMIYLGQTPDAPNPLAKAHLETWSQNNKVTQDSQGTWLTVTRSPLEGAGTWTHQYGTPDNSARSFDTLNGATRTDQLQVQWFGKPGPRAMADRNPRRPAPLYANGRLFSQGLLRIIAQDAYNGAILWSLEIPDFQRYNMPRDCGNWCADDNYVYAVVKDLCWRIEAATGKLDAVLSLAHSQDTKNYDWGYIAQQNNVLYGSAVKKETVYTNFWGKATAGWYDAKIGPVNNKVCSDALFALSKTTGAKEWSYVDGVIINPTITIGGGRMYFVECRNRDVKALDNRRIGDKKMWSDQYLVALDPKTGEKIWEKPIDTVDGTVVFYLLYAKETLIIGLSDKRYHLYAFDAKDGNPKWEASHDWTGNNHSGHMQHPVVVAKTVYLEPCGYDLDTGKRITDQMGRHGGCATYMSTEGALIYRGADRRISMWDVADNTVTNWPRFRPSCWLSTVAGGRMVLSPEGGGGCSCGNWMETSIAFAHHEPIAP